MEHPIHPLYDLFTQLGLSADARSIETFIAQHAPLPAATALADADFWTLAQAHFLCEAVRDDADWAAVVDQLDVLLRQPA